MTEHQSTDIQEVATERSTLRLDPAETHAVTVSEPPEVATKSESASALSTPSVVPAPITSPGAFEPVITTTTVAVAGPPEPPTPKPTAPGNAPILANAVLALAAATRRDLRTTTSAAAESQTTGLVLRDEPIAAADIDATPTLTLNYVRKPGLTAKVRGDVNATDPERNRLTYSTSAPTRGTVTINRYGQFTYTPTAAARHAAASTSASQTDKTDTFTVMVSDGVNTAALDVTVAIKGANARPSARIGTLSDANPITGAVSGTILATDRDGDALTFGAPAATAKGTVEMTGNGVFTYTPTAAARAAASSPFARSDRFTVTVTDSHGGVDTVTVRVKISPAVASLTQLAGIPYGAPVVDDGGTAYQLVGTGLLGLTGSKVLVVKSDGSQYATPTIKGRVLDGLLAAPTGGVVLLSLSGGKTSVTLVKPDATVSTASYSGGVDGPVQFTPDGAAYVTVGKLDYIFRSTANLVTMSPDGAFRSYTARGNFPYGASVGQDGTAFWAYQDGAHTKVLVVDPAGAAVTHQIDNTLVYQAVTPGPDGVGYLLTEPAGGNVTPVYRVSTQGVSLLGQAEGNSVGSVRLGADGTGYLMTYRQNFTTLTDHIFISRITASGISTSAPIKGRPMFTETIRVAPDGTAYLPVDADMQVTVGQRVLVISPNGTIVAVPMNSLYFVTDGYAIGPDSKFYVTSSFHDTVVISPNGTKLTLPFQSADPVQFTPDGTPVAKLGGRVRNITTGALSEQLPSDGPIPLDDFLIGEDGTILVMTYRGDASVGEVDTVHVLAARADGTTVAKFSDSGDLGMLTPALPDGVSYALVVGLDGTTKLWRLAPGGATKVGTFDGVASAPAAVGPDGRVYVAVLTSAAATKVHVITPATTVV